MVFIAGISISIFLIALLLFKKKKNKGDWILTTWFVFISLHLLLFYLDISGVTDANTFLAGIVIPFPLLHGPFLFLYASALTNRLSRNKFYNSLHFLPFLFAHIYLIQFYRLPGNQKLYILNNQGVGFEVFVQVHLILVILSGIGYIAATLFLIRKHQTFIQNKFSNIEKINLRWLQYLTYGLGLIWLFVIVGTEAQIFTSVVIYMTLIGFLGIQQTEIFTAPVSNQSTIPKEEFNESKQTHSNSSEKEPSKYEKSGLSEEMKRKLKKQLDTLMKQEKIYSAPDLSLQMLASRLDIHPNYLSQYVNEELGSTFYDYVNQQRVEEFKRIVILPENQPYNMLSLAYDCGFSSKSSFNRNFKKITGQTPSQYLAAVGNHE